MRTRSPTHSNLTDLDSFWQRITIRWNKIHSGFKATAEEIVCLSRSHFISVPSVYSQNTSSKPSLSAIVDRAGGLKTTRHDETNYYVQRQRRFDRNELFFSFFSFFLRIEYLLERCFRCYHSLTKYISIKYPPLIEV